MTEKSPRPRILSGMRPTGKIHLGNYMGALRNWVRLQNETDENGEPKYECYFFIADYHALTTDYADPSQLQQNTLDVALDWLAAGLDPEKSTIFVQSHVPQHAELHLLFSMITPLGWLERVPSYKDQQENLTGKDLTTYGFLGYPLLQAADILLYRPEYVPVGADQVAHVELTREVARRFNHLYASGTKKRRMVTTENLSAIAESIPSATIGDEVGQLDVRDELPPIFPEPDVILTPSAKLPGIDGRKMSKSYGNAIGLGDRPQLVLKKLLDMTNGGQRLHIADPGNPDVCPVGDLHKLLSPHNVAQLTQSKCRTAEISCSKCKSFAAQSIIEILKPIQANRLKYEQDPLSVLRILEKGAKEAGDVAAATMMVARSTMRLLSSKPERAIEEIDFYAPDAFTFASQLRESGGLAHNLLAYKGYWNAPRDERAAFLINYWKERIAPRELKLRTLSPFSFVTAGNKRIFSRTAREYPENQWHFKVQNKTAEVIVFLAWGRAFDLHDLVIPQKVYRASWPKTQERLIHFHITFDQGRYVLFLPDGTNADITDFHSRYEFLL